MPASSDQRPGWMLQSVSIPALARCTDLLVLQVSGNRSDDCLGRAAGVNLVAFPRGAHADRGGLVIMTDNSEDRIAQPRVGYQRCVI